MFCVWGPPQEPDDASLSGYYIFWDWSDTWLAEVHSGTKEKHLKPVLSSCSDFHVSQFIFVFYLIHRAVNEKNFSEMFVESEILLCQYLCRTWSVMCSSWVIGSFLQELLWGALLDGLEALCVCNDAVMTVCSFCSNLRAAWMRRDCSDLAVFWAAAASFHWVSEPWTVCADPTKISVIRLHASRCCCCCCKTDRWHFTILAFYLLKGKCTHCSLVIEKLWKFPTSNI